MLKDVLLRDNNIKKSFERGQLFFENYKDALAKHRKAVNDRLEVALREFQISMTPKNLSTCHMDGLIDSSCDYVRWLGWSLDDIGYFSTALSIDSAIISRRIVACHFVYQAGRIIDDIVDEHENYKGLRSTLLGDRNEYWHNNKRAEKEVLLTAVALLLRGIKDYSTCFGFITPTGAIHRLTSTAINACIGALVELETKEQNKCFYERLVELKSSAHNSILLQSFNGIIDEITFSQLHEFYKRSSLIGQIFNDAGDLHEDMKAGQINYFSGNRRSKPALTPGEAKKIISMLNHLIDFINQCNESLQTPCFTKFATFIHKAEQIEVQ